MASDDKHWAQSSIIDPLTEPAPHEVDGPGTHFTASSAVTSPVKTQSTGGSELSSNNPFRKASGSVTSNGAGTSHSRHGSVEKTGGVSMHTRQISEGRREKFPGGFPSHRPRASSDLRKQAFQDESPGSSRRRAGSNPNGSANHSRHASMEAAGRPRRSSSLHQRFPGDTSDQPLEMLKKDNKLANRSPHLRKHHQPLPDTVDALDKSAGGYHHAGPYDAALLVRNTSYESSPVAALKMTNDEALKATPDDKIRDSLNDHRPLDGTAIIPPGERDAFGRYYDYEEGADLMREPGGSGGGDNAGYKRWPGIQYHPDDLKGKGEPSYSIEKALKEHGAGKKTRDGEDGGIELVERPKPSEEPEEAAASGQSYSEWERQRSHGHAHKLSDGFKKRMGSLRRKDK